MIDLYMLSVDLKNNQSFLSQKSKSIILEIYNIINNPSEKTSIIMEAWKKDFRFIYGDVKANLSSNNKLDINILLESYGITPSQGKEIDQIQMLFFSIQTFFSILIKNVLKEIISGDEDFISDQDIILGRFTKTIGIKNFCNPDWYCWPVFELNNGFSKVLSNIRYELTNYSSILSITDFSSNNNYDYIKQIYEAIIPKELRHALGEYYTPDWLADETLKTILSFDENIIEQHFVDPTCGSGTFLFKTIIYKRKAGLSLEDILNTVSGIDINPLAVLTAKMNYLLAIIDLIDGTSEIEIPVYNSDVLNLNESLETDKLGDFELCEDPQKEIIAVKNAEKKKALSIGLADVIIGNPPWVNWEYLPEVYKKESQHLWLDYKLFSARGRDLSFSKEDISVLITYVVLDKLLRDGGILAFVIRQGVFKSDQNGVGFRRFKIKDECNIKVLRVDDLSKIKVFDNATNSTALVYLKKGKKTVYPVPYYLWEKRKDIKRINISNYLELKEIKGQIDIRKQKAMPAVDNDNESIWLTADEDELNNILKALGRNNYKARTGVFTGGANAIYWLNINKKVGCNIEVSNIVERAKRKSEKVIKTIEPTFVYPMLKGSNVKKWNTTYDTYLLCPHTSETKMWPVKQEQLRDEAPKTMDYLMFFKDALDSRKGFAGWEKEIQKQQFQAVLRVGDYTFSKYKVVWKYIASEFICAVIGSVNDAFLGEKTLIPNEKIMYVSTNDENEAYYLCGFLSSSIVANCVKSYMNPTSISAHVLNKLNIPTFDPNNTNHMALARICKEGHGKTDISKHIADIDKIVLNMYKR